MHSVIENDKQQIEKGKIIEEALNQGIGVFTPDIMFEKLVSDYKLAKQIFGESLIELMSGYDPRYIEKNIKIPEFQNEIKKKMEEKVDELKQDDFIDKENNITERGFEMASLVLYMDEIDKLVGKDVGGEKLQKKADIHGVRHNIKGYTHSSRYRDISVKKTVKTAVRRQHKQIQADDLRVFEREARGKIEIVYAFDASSSMKGAKIKNAKKAGVALAFKALEEKDKVGLIVFGDEVKASLLPSGEFGDILKEITKIKARGQTNLALTIKKSIELFSSENHTKHLILLTDALPTVGEEPEKETLDAVELAAGNSITVSIVGININEEGEELAKKIAELGNGRLYIAKDVEELDKIILLDYYSV
jgi:Mg-chelatase subunit ChlD